MQFEFICKIKPVLFISVIICNEFQCMNVLTEFLQSDRTGPVTELSLFSTGCMGVFCLSIGWDFLSIAVLSECAVLAAVSCVAVSIFFLGCLILNFALIT